MLEADRGSAHVAVIFLEPVTHEEALEVRNGSGDRILGPAGAVCQLLYTSQRLRGPREAASETECKPAEQKKDDSETQAGAAGLHAFVNGVVGVRA